MNEEQLKFQSLFLTVYHSPPHSLNFIYVEENANVEGIRSDERTIWYSKCGKLFIKTKKAQGLHEPKEAVLRPNP